MVDHGPIPVPSQGIGIQIMNLGADHGGTGLVFFEKFDLPLDAVGFFKSQSLDRFLKLNAQTFDKPP